jgi:hypothetical protein
LDGGFGSGIGCHLDVLVISVDERPRVVAEDFAERLVDDFRPFDRRLMKEEGRVLLLSRVLRQRRPGVGLSAADASDSMVTASGLPLASLLLPFVRSIFPFPPLSSYRQFADDDEEKNNESQRHSQAHDQHYVLLIVRDVAVRIDHGPGCGVGTHCFSPRHHLQIGDKKKAEEKEKWSERKEGEARREANQTLSPWSQMRRRRTDRLRDAFGAELDSGGELVLPPSSADDRKDGSRRRAARRSPQLQLEAAHQQK